MESEQLLDLLIETAGQVGLEVRKAKPGDRAPSDPPPKSGICRVAGNPWVVLASEDPTEFQVELLARALRETAGPALEERYLAPVVRTVIAGSRTS